MTVKTARVQSRNPVRWPLIRQFAVLAWIGILECIAFGQPVVAQRLAPANLRALLNLHGIDASRLDRFQDGEPFGATDEETLMRILQRIPRFPRHTLERWSHPHVDDWSVIASMPADNRAEIIHLAGRVKQVERSPLLPEVAQRLEFSEYYRVTLRLDGSSHSAVIYTRNVPRAWPVGHPMDEPAEALGIFLKSGPLIEGAFQLVFVADRVAWLPDRMNSDYGITSAHVYLAKLGFDIGLFDEARAENRKPLSLVDRECFYRLLAAVRGSERPEFIAQSQQPFAIAPLLSDPAPHHGELVVLEGIARRAIKVRVDDADVRERFGFDHYFQIDLFVDLNKQVIKLQNQQPGQDVPTFENSFPLTVCVPSLPADLPEGDSIRENVRVYATFFKLWTYSSNYVTSFDKKMLQVSPMLIGIEPRMIQPAAFNPGFGIGLVIVVEVSLVGIWMGIRRQGTRVVIPRSRTPLIHKQRAELNDDAGSELPDQPDFTNLS